MPGGDRGGEAFPLDDVALRRPHQRDDRQGRASAPAASTPTAAPSAPAASNALADRTQSGGDVGAQPGPGGHRPQRGRDRARRPRRRRPRTRRPDAPRPAVPRPARRARPAAPRTPRARRARRAEAAAAQRRTWPRPWHHATVAAAGRPATAAADRRRRRARSTPRPRRVPLGGRGRTEPCAAPPVRRPAPAPGHSAATVTTGPAPPAGLVNASHAAAESAVGVPCGRPRPPARRRRVRSTAISSSLRAPARSRPTCSTTRTAAASWLCSAARSSPPTAASASSRAGTSAGTVGVHRARAAVVAGVERGEQVDDLAAAHLADHDPVGPHPQRLPDQVAHGHLADALDVGVAGDELDQMRMPGRELGRVLDADDAFVGRDGAQRRRQQRRLARARSAGDEEGQPRRDDVVDDGQPPRRRSRPRRRAPRGPGWRGAAPAATGRCPRARSAAARRAAAR